MLSRIGVESIDELFDLIPDSIRLSRELNVAGAGSEFELTELMDALAAKNVPTGRDLVCFAGGGSYDHYLPAAVESLAARSEFVTAYTSFQPEISQGALQAIFEFQTMICELAGTEVSNASLYDGASACVEAINMAAAKTKRRRVLVSAGIAPHWRQVVRTFAYGAGIEIVEAPLVAGATVIDGFDLSEFGGVVVGLPNYLGVVEDLPPIAAAAHDGGALCIVAYDHVASGWLVPPGKLGADIVIGEGRSFGTPLNFGGPYLGLLSTMKKMVRLIPGRIVGETTDIAAKRGYVLTLQAREQHIRREKASSNVCTNQTLMAIAAGIHIAWLGPNGLRMTALASRAKTNHLLDLVTDIPGVELAVDGPFFREFPLRLPRPAGEALADLSNAGILGGIDLTVDYPELGDAILVAVTEKRTRSEIETYSDTLRKVVS